MLLNILRWRLGLLIAGLLDVQQLDLKDQHFVRADGSLAAAFAISQVRGNVEHPFAANLHLLQRHLPTLDDLVDPKRRRLSTLDRAIEDLAIDQLAGVVN